MAILKQSTSYTRVFPMVLSSDHISPATGKTVTVVISKAGGGSAGAAGAVSEIDNGYYKVALTAVDTNTAGELAYTATASGCDQNNFVDQVQSQVFTDLSLNANGQALISSNLKQNTAFTALFFMTLANTTSPAPGLTVTGQRTFSSSGFSPVSGTIAEVGGSGNGGGWYAFSGLAADSNSPVAGFKMSATGANDSDFTLWFQP